MALKLSLKANERIIAGAAVIKNVTGRTIELSVENEVPLLREKDILSEARAVTPSKRIYFVVQLMYVDSPNLSKYHKIYWDLAKDIIKAAPSTTPLFERISAFIYDEKYYQALKEIKKLIMYEEKVTTNARKSG
jgi:flagellar protein FlbT